MLHFIIFLCYMFGITYLFLHSSRYLLSFLDVHTEIKLEKVELASHLKAVFLTVSLISIVWSFIDYSNKPHIFFAFCSLLILLYRLYTDGFKNRLFFSRTNLAGITTKIKFAYVSKRKVTGGGGSFLIKCLAYGGVAVGGNNYLELTTAETARQVASVLSKPSTIYTRDIPFVNGHIKYLEFRLTCRELVQNGTIRLFNISSEFSELRFRISCLINRVPYEHRPIPLEVPKSISKPINSGVRRDLLDRVCMAEEDAIRNKNWNEASLWQNVRYRCFQETNALVYTKTLYGVPLFKTENPGGVPIFYYPKTVNNEIVWEPFEFEVYKELKKNNALIKYAGLKGSPRL